ncbi:GNAT family N-acetyltransferase [Oceanobacillus massiliensis]|uniref:GNAT family N-acetyltransferase n=1 Tax=Oceanobacillus massiliensis TaxID=1465765 RepID=UPI000287B4DE|nr:GNAT family N-acetyltransferase [Oceanobacillus massiliensis]
MELKLKNGRSLTVRSYIEDDFKYIQKLNEEEHWTNLAAKKQDTKDAWNNSNVTFVVLDQGEIAGYIRGLTDQSMTLFICELLISKDYRRLGIGQELLQFVHRLYPKTRIEMLASSTSRTFYEQQKYRPFYGFRKTYEEHD